MEPASIEIAGQHGLKLHALEWSREGTGMLFLHGFGNSCRVWDFVAPVVAPHYRVVALDQRGHGDSARDPEGRYDPETMAEDANAVLESLGIERVVLVGHSMGGRTSMAFAGLYPAKLAGLVLVDIGPVNDPRGVMRIRQEQQEQDTSFASVEDYRRVLTHQYPETAADVLLDMARHWTRERDDGRYELKLDPNFNLARGQLTPEQEEAREAESAKQSWQTLRRLPCPALVIRGAASDILSPDTADEMVDEAIPNATLEVIPRAAHSVMLDNPEAFEEALTRFALGE